MEYKRKNGATVNDRRSDPNAKPWKFVVFTDSFMSGWGGATGGRSLYALAVDGPKQADLVLTNGSRRSEMKRGRIVSVRRDASPSVRLRPSDHLSIVDRVEAEPWYQVGARSFALPTGITTLVRAFCDCGAS